MKTMSLCGKPRREERARKYLLSYASSAKNNGHYNAGGEKSATGAKRGKNSPFGDKRGKTRNPSQAQENNATGAKRGKTKMT